MLAVSSWVILHEIKGTGSDYADSQANGGKTDLASARDAKLGTSQHFSNGTTCKSYWLKCVAGHEGRFLSSIKCFTVELSLFAC